MQEFRGAAEYWAGMMQRPVTPSEAEQVIAKFLMVDHTEEGWKELPKAAKVLGLWAGYKSEMGANAYALYNVLTDYLSHRVVREGSASSTGLYNEGRLIKLLDNSPVFAV
jgi:hypothetical protein